MNKFNCHPVHIKAHFQNHRVHLGSRQGAIRVMVGGVYVSALWDAVHAGCEPA